MNTEHREAQDIKGRVRGAEVLPEELMLARSLNSKHNPVWRVGGTSVQRPGGQKEHDGQAWETVPELSVLEGKQRTWNPR